MIAFIKGNSDILIFLLIIFFTIDTFLLMFKLKSNFKSFPNLTISYDTLESYYCSFCDNKYKLAVIKLSIKNLSNKPIDIINIRLVDNSKSYLASVPEIKAEYNENSTVLINVFSENILNHAENMHLAPLGELSGYAVFENVDSITAASTYKIVVETTSRVFEAEITLSPLN